MTTEPTTPTDQAEAVDVVAVLARLGAVMPSDEDAREMAAVILAVSELIDTLKLFTRDVDFIGSSIELYEISAVEVRTRIRVALRRAGATK